jgi:hypothetical protein
METRRRIKATHQLIEWFRWNGAHKFEQTLQRYRCRFKKDGTLMVWRGTHLVCMGSYPPTLFYYRQYGDWETIRTSHIIDSFGDKKLYQTYYKLEEL